MGIFLAYLVPPTLLFLPLSQVIVKLNLYNTYWALILTYPTQLIPFASWLLMGYFRTIPKEIEECAMADGCTRMEALVRIILPLSMPGLISAGIFCFTLCWNEFLYALIFMSSGPMKTIPVGTVSDLIKADTLFWGSLMASAVLGSFPIAILYSFFVKYYVSGLTAGAVNASRVLKNAHLLRSPSFPCQARGRLIAAYVQVRLWPTHQLVGVARVAPYSSRRHSQDFGSLASGHF